jgi:hypothetical protein
MITRNVVLIEIIVILILFSCGTEIKPQHKNIETKSEKAIDNKSNFLIIDSSKLLKEMPLCTKDVYLKLVSYSVSNSEKYGIYFENKDEKCISNIIEFDKVKFDEEDFNWNNSLKLLDKDRIKYYEIENKCVISVSQRVNNGNIYHAVWEYYFYVDIKKNKLKYLFDLEARAFLPLKGKQGEYYERKIEGNIIFVSFIDANKNKKNEIGSIKIKLNENGSVELLEYQAPNENDKDILLSCNNEFTNKLFFIDKIGID